VFPGTALCAGCGGLEALRLAAKVLGDDVVYVNAAGCFTMLAVYPFTPFKGLMALHNDGVGACRRARGP
jgi:pyruvate ferredoxin oxidoreductase beta subunit